MFPTGKPAVVIVGTASEPASRNLTKAVVENHSFKSTGVNLLGRPVFQAGHVLLATFEQAIVEPPDLDSYFNPSSYVFLSRHSAESGIPSLTAHTTGNLTADAHLGGNPRELARSDPDLLKRYMRALARRQAEVPEYQLTIEATHHGPTSLQKPVLFVELGASRRNWEDEAAARVVAAALMESLADEESWDKVGVGLGGTHYPDKFTKLLVEGDMSLAFVVPKYALGSLDEWMMGQILQKSTKPVRCAAMDWKGLGQNKERVVSMVDSFGLEKVRL